MDPGSVFDIQCMLSLEEDGEVESFAAGPLAASVTDQSETPTAARAYCCPKIHTCYELLCIADFKPREASFRWKYIFIFCKLYHPFMLEKPSFSWGSFCNDLHWKREHLQIICSKKKYFISF